MLAHLTDSELPLLVAALVTGLVGGAGVVVGWVLRGTRVDSARARARDRR